MNPRVIRSLLNYRPHPSGYFWMLGNVIFVSGVSIYFLLGKNTQWMTANGEQVFSQGQWWRALTSVFIHADPPHVLSNLLTLAIFSFFIFSYYGRLIEVRQWFLFSFLLIGTWVTQLITLFSYDPKMGLLGFSGGDFVMMGFWLGCYGFTARNHTVRGRILRMLGVAILSLVPSQYEANVSYRAHWIGCVIGLIMGISYYFWKKEKIRSFDVYEVVEENQAGSVAAGVAQEIDPKIV